MLSIKIQNERYQSKVFEKKSFQEMAVGLKVISSKEIVKDATFFLAVLFAILFFL